METFGAFLLVYTFFAGFLGTMMGMTFEEDFIGYALCSEARESDRSINNLLIQLDYPRDYTAAERAQLRGKLAEEVENRRMSWVFGVLAWIFWPFVLIGIGLWKVVGVFANTGERGRKIRSHLKEASGPQDKV